MNTPTPSPSTENDRRQGRPAQSGQQSLKSQILDTAEQSFADKGYAATSMRKIADSAGVNPALIHYYFGNKQKLLKQVMERALQPMMDTIASFKDTPEVSITDIAGLLISMGATHPNIPRLLTREVLLPGGEMQEFFARQMAPRLGGALPALLEREMASGKLREDIDPSLSSLFIISICVFPFLARAIAEPVLGIDFTDEGIDKLSEQVSSLLKKGMSA
jgi:TetR/AcrR family transcriptional regulator